MENTTSTKALNVEIIRNSEGRIGGLHIKFGNGQELGLGASQLTNDIMEHAIWHGLKQKLVDAAAISRNPDTGRSATVDDKYNAVREVYDRLLSGQWNKGRDGTGSVRGGLLFRALCIMYPDKSPDAIRTYLEGKNKAEQAALRATKKIADIIETLRQDDAKDDTDADAMLDELNDL